MTREQTPTGKLNTGKLNTGIHALVSAEPTRTRPAGRILLLMTAAVTVGVLAGLLALSRSRLGDLETLPEIAGQTTPIPAATAPAADPTPTATAPAVAAVEEARRLPQAGSGVGAALASGQGGAIVRAPSQQIVIHPPTPTPTSTPLPIVAALDVVVGTGGAALYDDNGVTQGEVEQGALLQATARADNGSWLYVTLPEPDGAQGWIAADRVIVVDTARLAARDVTIIPMTPTPVGMVAAGMVAAGTPATAVEPAAPVTDGPTAQVTLPGARLNLRAGPGSGYAILAKAQPDQELPLLARNAAGDWLQVGLADGGFAWAATEYLRPSVAVRDLPVSDAVSDAPAQAEPAAPAQPATQGYAPAAPATGVTGLHGKLAIQVAWGGDIYLYDLATGDLRRLTTGFDPALSPDGTQVAFTRAGGEHGLYLIQVDGSNERRIFTGRELLRAPKWSPDGHYIVFERGDEFIRIPCEEKDTDYCSIPPNLEEERRQKLARVDVNGGSYQDIPVLERARVADWNRAGIVYQSPAGIQVTQDQPSAQSQLVFFNIQKQYEQDPDWQPNGGRILFQRRENNHWEIFSVAPDGSGLTALTRPQFTLVEKLPSNVAPAWSPDGQHIVFLSNRQPNHSAGAWRVWVMNADGSNQRPLPLELPLVYTYVAEQMVDWGR
jgi:Tol biopolymer transport system component